MDLLVKNRKKPPAKGCALLIIDMLNDYLTPEGAVYCAECRVIIPHIAAAATFVRENGGSVFYVNTQLRKTDILAKKWGLHAVKGTKGARVVDELSPEKQDLIVLKKSYDGFYETRLNTLLRSRGITTVLLSGIHTHVCVTMTGVGAFERGYSVVALEDCFTTGHRANHDSRLRFFGSHIGVIERSNDWILSVSR